MEPYGGGEVVFFFLSHAWHRFFRTVLINKSDLTGGDDEVKRLGRDSVSGRQPCDDDDADRQFLIQE